MILHSTWMSLSNHMNFSNLNKINYKHKLVINTSIFIAACFLLSYFLLISSIDEINTLKKDIISQKVELEKNKSRDKNVDKLSEDIKKIEPEIGLLNQVFIDSNKELEFITVLEGIADKNRVMQTININKEKTTKLSLYAKTPITVNVEGNYPDLIAYLKEVETLKIYINIKSLSMSLNSNPEENGDSAQNRSSLASKGHLQFTADTFWK